MKTPARRATLFCALMTSTVLAVPAPAQTPQQPSVFQHVDSNGVDLTDGSFNFALVEGSIGAGEGTLAIARTYGRAGFADGLPGRLHRSLFSTNNRISLAFGSRAEHFDRDSNFNWVPQKHDGAILTGSGSSYTYTSPDGTVVEYGAPGRSGFATYPLGGGIAYCVDDNEGECELVPLSVTRPNGRRVELHWRVNETCGEPQFPEGQPCTWFPRLAGISNESAYLGKYLYADNGSYSGGPPTAWFRRTGVQLVNTALAACDPQANACATAHAAISYSTDGTQITDPAGGVWQIVAGASSFTVTRPGSSTPNVSVTRNATTGVVSQVTADGVTTSYSRSVSGSTVTMSVTNALSQQTTVVSDLNVGRPTAVTDPLNRTTEFQYDAYGRPTRVTAPEDNYTHLTYDVRGNVTQTQHVAKPGSGTATITTSASFPSTCTNVVTCNLPTSTTDARNNSTAYTYNQTHGGVETVTGPAVTVNGQSVQPQVRTSYTQSGGVWLPTQVSACQTSASCTNTADEVRTTIAYGTNLQPTSTSRGNGAGTLTTTSSMFYDAVGNLITVDGPLAGAADTVRYRYDAVRRRIGTVSPDPDGAGALPHRAARTTYREDGQVTRTETGIVNSQSDSDWAQMIVLERSDVTFDANNRPAVSSRQGGGTIVSVVQTSYDALGRPDCVAQRMNPTNWNSLPASACTPLAAGSYGPDRITQTVRDAAGQVTERWSAVGTALAAREVLTDYTDNGRVEWVQDGEGNRTSYQYDGQDRLARTYFPLAAQGSNASNSADYEELGYDSAGNVTSRRNRAGETASYTFDALNRTTAKDLPGSEPDVAYGYDLLGRMLSATQPGHAIGFTYDALGRRLTQTNPMGTVTSTWDIAGRRTRITHPGNTYYVDQDYLVTGEMIAIRENGATSGLGVIAVFGYDTLGRRTSLTRGNGSVTTYAYDSASRLQTQSVDLAGTTSDLTLGFTYNPAGQIVTGTRSNDLYSFTGQSTATTNSTVNGLNQLTLHGAAAPAHDARGNLISDGNATFGYSSENLLTSTAYGTRTHAVSYDPLMRFFHITTSGATSRSFLMDGDDAIVTHRDGQLLNRTVYGPRENEPLYQLEYRGYRHWFPADERGSVIAMADETSGVWRASYDEYGDYQGSLQWHGFAGGMSLPPRLFRFGTRVYHPQLGRFLQTDPIGYGDGMNMYAYVGGDPVNWVDPSGLNKCKFGEVDEEAIEVCGDRQDRPQADNRLGPPSGGFAGFYRTAGLVGAEPSSDGEGADPIVVTGTRPHVVLASGRGSRRGGRGSSGGNNQSSEHRRNARPSTQERHQQGQARQNRDRGGEKADARRRPPRVRPRNWSGPWPPRFWWVPLFPDTFDFCSPLYRRLIIVEGCEPEVI